MTLQGRELILGVGGGISAYKSADLLRRLQDVGFVVSVMPTRASLNFVGAATWEALSGQPVAVNLWNKVHEVPHIKAARSAHVMVIAPATADLIAKIANGICDDLLTNTISASSTPIILVPAMHPEMWGNPSTVENVAKLRSRGHLVIEPDEGRMTGDDFGVGRYPEVSRIISEISSFLELKSDFQGKKVLITAGGTREAIDAVRYIGNISSGKQGYSLAKAARNRGAEVVLISANTNLSPIAGVRTIDVTSTSEMRAALATEFASCDALFMAAAVADARPKANNEGKIKKADLKSIELELNPDLIAEISTLAKTSQVLIAFAAETGDLDLAAAKAKLVQKGAQLLYLNNVSKGAIFGSDRTSGFIIDGNSLQIECPDQNKDTLSDLLLDQVRVKLG